MQTITPAGSPAINLIGKLTTPDIKLCASTLGWMPSEEDEIRRLFQEYGIRAIEVTTDRLLDDFAVIDKGVAYDYKDSCNAAGIDIVAMQGLLYGHQELKIFGSAEEREKTLTYLKHVIDIAEIMNVKNMNFGSAKNRRRDHQPKQDIEGDAIKFFWELSEYAFMKGARFNIEPLTEDMECDYITDALEAAILASRIDHPKFGIVLDTATLISTGEMSDGIVACAGRMNHYHISRPGLAPVHQLEDKTLHREFAETLRSIGYRGHVSIEMKKSDAGNVESMRKSIELVKKLYDV